jgi:hypothetical protein
MDTISGFDMTVYCPLGQHAASRAAQSMLTRTHQMVVAQGLGHEDRQKTRNETRDRRSPWHGGWRS